MALTAVFSATIRLSIAFVALAALIVPALADPNSIEWVWSVARIAVVLVTSPNRVTILPGDQILQETSQYQSSLQKRAMIERDAVHSRLHL